MRGTVVGIVGLQISIKRSSYTQSYSLVWKIKYNVYIKCKSDNYYLLSEVQIKGCGTSQEKKNFVWWNEGKISRSFLEDAS